MQTKIDKLTEFCTRNNQNIVETYLVAKTWIRRNMLTCNRLIHTLGNSLSINTGMARHGIIFLTFGLILLGFKQTSENNLLPSFVPPPPACLSNLQRIFIGAISFILMIFVFWILLRYKLVNFSKGRLKAFAYFIIFYILVLLLTYFILWIPTIPVSLFIILGIIAILTSLIFMVAVFCKRIACKLKSFLIGQARLIYWTVFWGVYTIGWLKGMSTIPADTNILLKLVFLLAFFIGLLWFFVIGTIYLNASLQRKS